MQANICLPKHCMAQSCASNASDFVNCCSVNRDPRSPMCGECVAPFVEWNFDCIGASNSCLVPWFSAALALAECETTRWDLIALLTLACTPAMYIFHVLAQTPTPDATIFLTFSAPACQRPILS